MSNIAVSTVDYDDSESVMSSWYELLELSIDYYIEKSAGDSPVSEYAISQSLAPMKRGIKEDEAYARFIHNLYLRSASVLSHLSDERTKQDRLKKKENAHVE